MYKRQAQEVTLLYEYRSASEACLQVMKGELNRVVNEFRAKGDVYKRQVLMELSWARILSQLALVRIGLICTTCGCCMPSGRVVSTRSHSG